MKSVPYVSVIGSIVYDQICTHTNLIFIISMFGEFQRNSRIGHSKSVKKSYDICNEQKTSC
jgi:hypothetical protein